MVDQNFIPSPLVLSGSNVLAGEGTMMVIAVGDNSAFGEIRRRLEVRRPQETPL